MRPGGKMAIGAIFLTCPTALLGSLYLSALHGLDSSDTLVAYAVCGTLTMAAFTLINGLGAGGGRR